MLLDRQVMNLARAIRQMESGNRAVLPAEGASVGGASRYQYTHGTWKSVAGKYLGDPNAPLTAANENKATYYRILDWKKKGYNPAQIASMWNAGEGKPNAYKENWKGVNKFGVAYDTPAYVNKVYAKYKELENTAKAEQARRDAEHGVYNEIQAPEKKSMFRRFGEEMTALIDKVNPVKFVAGTAKKTADIWKSTIENLPKDVTEAAKNINAGGVRGLVGTVVNQKAPYLNYVPGMDKVLPQEATQQTTKGILKSTLRPAADVGQAVLAPVFAGFSQLMEQTGGQKAIDWTAEKIDSTLGISDAKWLQNYAIQHPNAEEDINRALVLMGTLGETGQITPKGMKDVLVKLKDASKTGAEGLVGASKQIVKDLETARQERIIKEREKAIYDIENSYAGTRKAMDYSKDANAASRKRIASTDVLANAVDENGLIRTKQKGGAVEQYKKSTIDGVEGVVRENLVKEGIKVPLEEVKKVLTKAVMDSRLEGSSLTSALKSVENEIAGLKLRADELNQVGLEFIHDAKISANGKINFLTPYSEQTANKAISNAYKQFVESKWAPAKEINAELTKYYKDIELLKSLDGKRVKGGKLGKYFSQIAGNLAGGAVGAGLGGYAGAAAGSYVGGELGSFIRGKAMSSTFGKSTGKVAERNAILEKASKDAKTPKKLDLKKADTKVRASKKIEKTKEIMKVEKKISDNVDAQKKAIKAKNYKLVYRLKQVYKFLVEKLKELARNASAGLSIKDVTKNILPKDKAIMQKYINNVESKLNVDEAAISKDVEMLAKKFGISDSAGSQEIAYKFSKILEGKPYENSSVGRKNLKRGYTNKN